MRPSPRLCSKASRFQLSSKHANKDYYKGRRQSHPDGIGYRTGPPGAFVGHKSIFKVDDTKARVFVGPLFKADGSSEFAFSQLKPFASAKTPPAAGYPWGLPGNPTRRVEWYAQMSEDLRKLGPGGGRGKAEDGGLVGVAEAGGPRAEGEGEGRV